jgi:hypothetical protein
MLCKALRQRSFLEEIQAGHLVEVDEVELDVSGQIILLCDCRFCGRRHSFEIHGK